MEKGSRSTPHFEVRNELEIGTRPGSVEKRGISRSDLKQIQSGETDKGDNSGTVQISDKKTFYKK